MSFDHGFGLWPLVPILACDEIMTCCFCAGSRLGCHDGLEVKDAAAIYRRFGGRRLRNVDHIHWHLWWAVLCCWHVRVGSSCCKKWDEGDPVCMQIKCDCGQFRTGRPAND